MESVYLRLSDSLESLIYSRKERWYHKYTNVDLLNEAWAERKKLQKRIDTIISNSKSPSVYGDMSLESKGINEKNLQALSDQLCLLSTLAKYKQIVLQDNVDEELSGLFRYNLQENDNLPPITLIIGFILGLICDIFLVVYADIGGSFWDILFLIMYPFLFAVSWFLLILFLSAFISFVFNAVVAHTYNNRYWILLSQDTVAKGINEIEAYQRDSFWNEYRKKRSSTNKTCNSENRIQENRIECVAPTIQQRWDLVEFAKLKGKMQVGTFEDKETGKTFKSNIFTDKDGNKCYVSFSSKLGELNAADIVQKKDQLEVVLNEDGLYVLQEKE
jgi:hypothetical protein